MVDGQPGLPDDPGGGAFFQGKWGVEEVLLVNEGTSGESGEGHCGVVAVSCARRILGSSTVCDQGQPVDFGVVDKERYVGVVGVGEVRG